MFLLLSIKHGNMKKKQFVKFIVDRFYKMNDKKCNDKIETRGTTEIHHPEGQSTLNHKIQYKATHNPKRQSKLNHKIQYKNIHNPERQSTVNHKIQYKQIHNPERQSTVSHKIQYKKLTVQKDNQQ